MKIRIKILVTVFALILITGVATTIVSETVSEHIVGEGIKAHLETTAQSRANHIESFLDSGKKNALQLSESIVIERLLTSNKTDEDYERLN